MRRFLKAVTNLLLLLVAFQVFGLNTVACAAPASNTGSRHNLAYITTQYSGQASIRSAQHKRPVNKAHCHHHKAYKKYFPGKVIVSRPVQLEAPCHPEPGLVHYAAVAGYQFLYFKSINPPPPKA